jgi:hypothetical protein
VAYFKWLAIAIPLLAWGFWIGDNEHWFYSWSPVFAAVVAAAIPLVATVRTAKVGATAAYLAIHLWGSVFLLLSFVVAIGYESVHDIEGFTAESAAQKVFEQMASHMAQPVRLVEHVDPGQHLPGCRHYLILGADEPRGRFSICPHWWFGWSYASSYMFSPSRDELARARAMLEEGDSDRAAHVLQEVIANFPGTPAEAEAKELMASGNGDAG